MTNSTIYSMRQLRQRHEDPLNLRSLPLVAPPEDGWSAIESELLDGHKRRTLARVGGGALAAAAAVTLAFGLYLGQHDRSATEPDPIPTGQPALAANAADPVTGAPPAEPELNDLIAMSQRLEGGLRAYRSRYGDLPAGALVYQVELEDLIAQVDEQLSMNPDSPALWSQRVNLMLDLSTLYENSLRREYHQIASL